MKAYFTGNYRGEASVMFKGVGFCEDQASDVSEEWFDNNLHPLISDKKPKKKKAEKIEVIEEVAEVVVEEDAEQVKADANKD